MTTTWRRHPKYTSYEVSSDGRIRRFGRELKLFPKAGSRTAYLHSSISVAGVAKNFYIHILVCETFHGPRPSSDYVVRHLNGDYADNRAENLTWGTKSENQLDKGRHGTDHQRAKKSCPVGHNYDEPNTYIAPSGWRTCRRCRRDRERDRRHRLRAAQQHDHTAQSGYMA